MCVCRDKIDPRFIFQVAVLPLDFPLGSVLTSSVSSLPPPPPLNSLEVVLSLKTLLLVTW